MQAPARQCIMKILVLETECYNKEIALNMKGTTYLQCKDAADEDLTGDGILLKKENTLVVKFYQLSRNSLTSIYAPCIHSKPWGQLTQ